MSITRFLGHALLAVTLGITAACNDSTGPGTISSIDADAAMTKMEPVAAVLEQPMFSSLEGAGNYLGGSFGIQAVASLTTKLTHSGFDARVLRNLAPTAPVAASVVPNTVKGTTYVFDEVEAAYIPDPDATGAPAAGVRVILYAWNPLTGAPASPLNRVGYVDLIDESTSTSDVLRVRLVREEGSAVLADYTISHSVTNDRETFGINGSANDGTTTVNFNLNGSTSGATGAEAAIVHFSISAPSRGASISLEMSVDASTGQSNIGLTLGYDGHTLTFDLSGTEDAILGEVRFDGALYARYEASYATGEGSEQWEKADGTPLTAEELERLTTLFSRSLEVTGFWSALLWPVHMFATA